MKYFFCAFLLVLVASQTYAQYKRKGETLQNPRNKSKKADYTIAQFKGKWQEYARQTRTDIALLGFTDTVQLIFSDSNKVVEKTTDGSFMTVEGEAEIYNDNLLSIAGDEYTVKSLTDIEMVLDDGKYVRHFKKVDMFYYERKAKAFLNKKSDANSQEDIAKNATDSQIFL
ncbi:MAG: hypothetical protein JST87_06940 [Bacteroidetes bacterium]|nr:hypothetical protein [Bacteroidota bacterium]MBS1933360.1 hypothetical protein [Bacteroidota bacterium]